MKKFIALLVSAAIIATPVAFADDQPAAADQDAAMQKMSSTADQTTSAPAKSSKKKAHCHHCHCHHGKKAKKSTAQ